MRFVKINKLKSGMTVGLRVTNMLGQRIVQQGTILNENMIQRMKKEGYQGLYIADSISEGVEIDDSFDCMNYCSGSDSLVLKDFAALNRIAVSIVDDMVRYRPERISIQTVQPFGESLFCHSISTTIYSVLLGKRLGLDRAGLYMLAKAAMLHDIGMVDIPISLRTKRSGINNDEKQIIRKHVIDGAVELANAGMDKFLVDVVLAHHENENGSGYPNGSSGTQIPDFAKIIHVADVIDDMTTRKKDRDAYLMADVLDYLTSGIGILFHKAVVFAAAKVFDAYPIGAEVTLSNDKAAFISGRTEDNTRPIVTLLDSGETVNLLQDEEYKYVTIKSCEFGSTNVSTEEDENQEDTETAAEPKKQKRRVVVVDDVFICRKNVENALHQDFEVICFENAYKAINYIRQYGADLVVMDIEMPELDGVSAVKKLRAAGCDIPVIYLTAVNDKRTVIECVTTGAKDYVLKPIRPIYIYERVRDVLAEL